jgi:hypothetical protein
MPRSRPAYLALLIVTVLAGLASRQWPAALPAFIASYAGDALWATMVVWLLALAWPRTGTLRLALTALTIAVAVEVSQLYHAPWIDGIRATRAGALALGQGFLWSDLACYAVGVTLAAGVDAWLVRRQPFAVRK